MPDKELSQQVLGLASPWWVDRVELNVEHCPDIRQVATPRRSF